MGTSTISMAIFNSELLTRQWPSIHVEITTEMDAMDGFLTIKHGLGKRHCCFYHIIAISHEQNHLVGGWYTYPNLKNDGVKVSWDDDIPNMDK